MECRHPVFRNKQRMIRQKIERFDENMDKIKIVDLEVFANHGVFEEEQKLGQKFLVDAVL